MNWQILAGTVVLLLSGCNTISHTTSGRECVREEFTARVTFYGNDKRYGNRISSHPTRRAQPFVTVAVDPKFIPYGTRLKIEGFDQIFVAEDTGSAVISKRASSGKYPIVDVYVCTSSNVNRLSIIYWQRYHGLHRVQIIAKGETNEFGTSNGRADSPSVTHVSLLKYPDLASGERR